MLKVILGHRGCTVASYTKDTKQKLAQMMDKVHTIKLSLVQIWFFALLCAVSEVSHPRVFPVLREEMELWCRIWTAVCCKLMTSPWSTAGVKRGKSHKLDCESCDGSC